MVEQISIPEGLISKSEIFDSKTQITKVIPAVKLYDAVIVNKGDEYYGIIDSRAIYRSIQGLRSPKNQAASNFVVKVPKITDSTAIDDVIYYFYKTRARALPYVKNGKVLGVLKRVTLLKMLLSESKIDSIKAGDAMVSPIIGISVDSTVGQARAVMRENKINRLAVVDGDKFAGIITNYDLIDRYVKTDERRPAMTSTAFNVSQLKLATILQKNPLSIDAADSLDNATRLMIERGVSSLVVTHKGKPVGMLTELDVVENAMGRGRQEDNQIFISGLDSQTYEYEDETREMVRSFMGKIQKMNHITVDYVSIVVKHFRLNSYELHARLALAGSGGIINAHVTGHLFERTISDLLGVLENEVKKKKGQYLTMRKILNMQHAEDEE
jgi:CBS domain-containing protein